MCLVLTAVSYCLYYYIWQFLSELRFVRHQFLLLLSHSCGSVLHVVFLIIYFGICFIMMRRRGRKVMILLWRSMFVCFLNFYVGLMLHDRDIPCIYYYNTFWNETGPLVMQCWSVSSMTTILKYLSFFSL